MSRLDPAKLHPAHEPHFSQFPSRRSTVFSAKGAIATSQPLACQAGLEILQKGGNAADAAVAVAAAMNVCEPCSTGIGGDMFCLFYDAKTKSIKGINGSGKAPQLLTLDHLKSRGISGAFIPSSDLNSVTVPGAAAGWLKTISEFGSGSLTVEDILGPAIRMAREGVPIHELTSREFQRAEAFIKKASPGWPMMMIEDGSPPLESHIMCYPKLADTFESIAKDGHKGFYQGRIAEAIASLVQSKGGLMSMEDLALCEAELIEPIKYEYKASQQGSGITLWECPPNGQGLTALVAMGIIEAFEDRTGVDVLSLDFNSAEYLHVLIEALRLAFAAQHFVGDPRFSEVPVSELLDKSYLAGRAKLIDATKTVLVEHGDPLHSSDTIYLATADRNGNACSFIASNYGGASGFGTGAIPEGCGFTLQSRGSGFSLQPDHPNCVQGGKRPYHTIIPGMVTQGGDLLMTFGVMGGFMQPQGQVQVLLNKLRGFTSQEALDAPRFCISSGMPDTASTSPSITSVANSEIWFEDGISDQVVQKLRGMGHRCERATEYQRSMFGRGQIIQAVQDPSGRNVWACGSDPRGDGMHDDTSRKSLLGKGGAAEPSD